MRLGRFRRNINKARIENGTGTGNREQGTVLKIPPTREYGDGPQKKFEIFYKK